MKKQLLTMALTAMMAVPTTAQNPQRGDYGYLYCHMNGNGRAWTAYALSRDGLHYHDLLGGDSVFSDTEHARIEGATRDAYIFRRHDCSGYLMLCTDMNVGAFKRLKKEAEWDNYGITLLRSDDLIHWESTSFDYRQGPAIFSDAKVQGKKPASVYKNWATINRVWAPQAVWDPTYRWPDGRKGGYFVYYSMWNRAEEKYDRMYYSYANEDFTELTQPRLLFDWGYATIDADINWLDSDRQWHMMIKKEGGQPGLFTSTAKKLTGPWPEPVADDYVNFEGKKKCEGVSAFQLAGEEEWTIAYIEYSSRPKNYRLCKADKYMRNFRDPRNIEGVSGPQHGSFLRLTKAEYDRLEQWSASLEVRGSRYEVRENQSLGGTGARGYGSTRLPSAQELSSHPRTTAPPHPRENPRENGTTHLETLTSDWLFSRDKKKWQTVSVPHDWAISGPFDKKWDLQVVAIEQNGEKTPTEKSGRSGALPWIGEGHYKRNIFIPADFKGHAELLFDGAMAEPTVTVNGQKAGYWAYGYNAFRVDISKLVKPGANLVEVDLQNVEESSRWYPGAGIYRPVTLILKGEDWIDPWKTYIRTTAIEGNSATVEVTVGTGSKTTEGMAFEVELRDQKGRIVDHRHQSVGGTFTLTIANAQLWTPETPYLYKAHVKLMKNGQPLDEIVQNVGLRTVKVSKEGGFQLNGVSRKIKGVCLHHDLGPLGAAVNKAALIRQIKTMKAMGCDAIRTSHNMPSQMQMDLCDSLGMMVMAESFDMWKYPKCKNGYARFFDEWSDRDIENLVLANRNHPAIVMWSIGNEIPEQGDKKAIAIIDRLQGLCHKLDPSRPVTQGLDRVDNALQSGFAQAMDIPGLNYRLPKYEQAYKTLTHGFLLGSETTSTVSSRGVYKFPVETNDYSKFSSWMPGYDPTAVKDADGQCSSYDVEYCAWSNLPDDDWRRQEDYPWVIGEFVWTGYDYLGEPTPFDEYWPSRSSYFGICDLAGLPKDRYYLYRSHWNTNEHTIHLLPHWSWGTKKDQGRSASRKGDVAQSQNRIGLVTPVYCYTDYPEGELFVNGKSQGRIKKWKEESGKWSDEHRLDRYRLRWNNVVYEPGEVKVVVYDEQGRKAGEQTMKTPGEPAKLQLDVWTQQSESIEGRDNLSIGGTGARGYGGTRLPSAQELSSHPRTTAPPHHRNNDTTHPRENDTTHPRENGLTADGQDLAFVTVSLTDADGTLIPDAADQLRFEVEGAGTFRAVCNGDATSLEPFTEPTMRLFNGQLVVIVQAGYKPGQLTLKVTDDQRRLSETITIPVK